MTPIDFKNALVTVDTCKAALSKNEDAVLADIESGKLKYVFDLAAPDRRRRMLRVFVLSLYDLLHGTDSQPPNVDGVARYAIPGGAAELRASWLALKLNCSTTHVHALMQARCLREVSSANRTQTADRILTRASAMEFLISRRCM